MDGRARTLGISSLAVAMLASVLVMVAPGGLGSVGTVSAAAEDPDIVTLTPARLLETRPGESTVDGVAEGIGRRQAGQVTELSVAGRGGVAADATAAVLNIAAIKPDARAYVTAFPCSATPPTASSLNVSADNVRANGAVARLSANGTVCLFTSQAMHLVVDVVGYLSPDSPIEPLPPARLLETRAGEKTIDGEQEAIGTLDPGETLELLPLGRGGVADDAEAVLLNLAAVGGEQRAFVTAWPCGTDKPLAASLNVGVREAIANNLIAKIGDGGAVCLESSASIDVIIDAVGYVPPGSGTTILRPARLLETRPGEITIDGEFAGIGTPGPGEVTELTVAGRGGVDPAAEAVVLNLAAANPSKLTYVTVWPCGAARPLAASLNIDAGAVSNGVISRVGAGGKVCFYSPDSVDLIVDVTGWIAPGTTTTITDTTTTTDADTTTTSTTTTTSSTTTTTTTTTTSSTTTTTEPDGPDEFEFPLGTTIITSSPTPTSIGVQWPALDGATSYTVTVTPGGFQEIVAAPATSATVDGLTADTAYTVSLTATNGTDTTPALESPQRTDPAPIPRNFVVVPTPPAGVTTTAASAEFLYTGADPVQVGVDPGALVEERIGIVSGRILDVSANPIEGATVSVLEDGRLGHTVTATDGVWDLAVNGGAQITIDVTAPGYLPSQRTIDIDWAEWATVDDIVLVAVDPEQTVVGLDGSLPGTSFTTHSASTAVDLDGPRVARVLVRDGTQATLEFADGSSRPTDSLTISVTEYTEGPTGEAAMPGSLPDTTGFTYAVEATAAEAVAAGATGVSFDQPVLLLTDNFLGTPVGTFVPTGTYNRAVGRWESQPDGLVLRVVSIVGGVATIDVDGDGDADGDDAALLPLDVAERTELATLYQAGDTFWRTELMHFSPHDLNYRTTVRDDVPIPDLDDDITDNINRTTDVVDDSTSDDGYGTIDYDNQILREAIPLAGTDQVLAYSSARVEGRGARIVVPAIGPSVPAGATGNVQVSVVVAGRTLTTEVPLAPNQTVEFEWDGIDRWGRPAVGTQNARVSVTYNFGAVYTLRSTGPLSPERARSFLTATTLPDTVQVSRRPIRRSIESLIRVTGVETEVASLGLGGWNLSGVHRYDVTSGTLLRGDGTRERVSEVPGQFGTVRPIVGDGDPPGASCDGYGESCGDGGDALDASILTTIGSVHYDAAGDLLLLTDSARRLRHVDAETGIITTIAGDGSCLTRLNDCSSPPSQVSVDPASCDTYADACGDGGPATSAQFVAFDVQTGPDGAIYLLDAATLSVRRIDTSGTISTVAGSGDCVAWSFIDCTGSPDDSTDCGSSHATCGDGGSALDAPLGYPQSFLVTADGTIFIGSLDRIRRVTTDGVIQTVSGTGGFCFDGETCGDFGEGSASGMAADADWQGLRDMVELDDGSVLVVDESLRVVRRITPDARIERWAGTYFAGAAPDGPNSGGGADHCYDAEAWDAGFDASELLAQVVIDPMEAGPCAEGEHRLDTPLPPLLGIDVGPDGAVYLATGGFIGPCDDDYPDYCGTGDWNNDGFFNDHRLLRVAPDGTISRHVGTGPLGQPVRGAFATTTAFDGQNGFAISPDGAVVWPTGTFDEQQVWRVEDATPPLESDERFVPDGGFLHVFDESGRHLRTETLRSRAVVSTIQYDSAGRLTGVVDRSGNTTSVQRDGSGVPLAVVSPYGDTTTLTLDGDGYVETVTNPESETTTLAYEADTGLLISVTGARPGSTYTFVHDDVGRVQSATDPEDGTRTVTQTSPSSGVVRTVVTNPAGESTIHVVQAGAGGSEFVRTTERPDGAVTTVVKSSDGTQTVTAADGTTVTSTFAADPQYGGGLPYVAESTTTSDFRESTTTTERDVTLGVDDELESFTEFTDVEGDWTSFVHDLSTRTLTTTTEGGLESTVVLDEVDRPIEETSAGGVTVVSSYDGNGRLESTTADPGPDERVWTFTWDDADLESTTDPESNVTTFSTDDAGRPTGVGLPDGDQVGYGLDDHGNLVQVTVPSGTDGSQVHTQAFDLRDRMTSHTDPDALDGDGRVMSTTYDLGGRVDSVTRPDGESVTFDYVDGRLDERLGDGANIEYGYDTSGRMTSAEGELLTSFDYTGFLTDSITTSDGGAIDETVFYDYDERFRVAYEAVGSTYIERYYDNNGNLSEVGNQDITRDPTSGWPTSRDLGNIVVEYDVDDHGDLVRTTATDFTGGGAGVEIYDEEITRDGLGRVTERTETVAGGSAVVWTYQYDARGRLVEVTEGATTRTYAYDDAGNLVTSPRGTLTYDVRDRLLGVGTATVDHDDAGDLVSITDGATTTFDIDATNLLQGVTVGGVAVTYAYDGLDRRVGRSEDGVLDRAWLYGTRPSPLAELDGSGDVSSVFVYGLLPLTPDYIVDVDDVNGNAELMVISDWRGSPRLVVDSADGTIVQRMDYDELGAIVNDTDPELQPFGFQGGLVEADTGLVRFGARDYDPAVGRFTSRDPILFGGAQTNLYLFADGDPVNGSDPSGLGPNECQGNTGDTVANGLGWVSTTISVVAPFVPGASGVNAGRTALGFDVASRGTQAGFGSDQPSHPDPIIAESQTVLNNVSTAAGVAGVGGNPYAGALGAGTAIASKITEYVGPPFYPVTDAVVKISEGESSVADIGRKDFPNGPSTSPLIGCKF